LKNLLDRYDGSVSLALAAYNWGMGNIERHPEKLPKETRSYIARVNNLLYKEIL
jgi:soluble lytic murein transglycosylase-like protein